jgi:2-hydroxychromene-2-carboxylate isomerase
MPRTVEFWFDFASTYSYLTAMRIERLCADSGLRLDWKPMLLGPIFADNGWSDSPFNLYPAKGANMWRDMERQSAKLGLPLRRPSHFPRGSLLAARIACANADAPWIGGFVAAVFHANFALDLDIAAPSVIGDILIDLGQDAPDIIARAQQAEAKLALRDQTEMAVQKGVFGAPTMLIGTELFWGNDRLDDALGWAVNAA